MIITTRFVNYLGVDKERTFSKEEISNIVDFLKLEVIPKDMLMSMIKDINRISDVIKGLKKVLMADGVIDKVMK